MLDIVKTPVARMVTVNLSDDGRAIEEAAAPTNRIKVAAFVEKLFPKMRIEHLGRPEMVEFNRYCGICEPSSLFFQTVHKAYAYHHALGLRPEVLMYLINAVVAETVHRYPEDYRDLFTTRQAKVKINVRHDKLVPGNLNSPWDEAIEMFDKALRPHVPSRVMNQLVPEFTTVNQESQLALLLAFMDSASPYYDYEAVTLCGIPRIVLFGEAADYRRLVIAATELARAFQKHLAAYFGNLLPVLETIAQTAETGYVDVNFWGQIYKHYSASGTSRFSGWISSFLWYVRKPDRQMKTNPLVAKDRKLANWQAIDSHSGIDSGSEPSHVSCVPFAWHYVPRDTPNVMRDLPMHFIGGVLGVDVIEEALTPALSYGVVRAP